MVPKYEKMNSEIRVWKRCAKALDFHRFHIFAGLAGQKVFQPVAACGGRLGCPKKPFLRSSGVGMLGSSDGQIIRCQISGHWLFDSAGKGWVNDERGRIERMKD